MFYYNPSHMLPYSSLFDQAAMWDRNKIITPGSEIALLTPVGGLVQPDSVQNICMGRANELVALVENTDKKIHVLWSGGIDSTAALLCLREVVPANKLVVMYTPQSLVEYPGFFEQHIQGIFETFQFSMSTTWRAIDFACANGLLVTGEIGDQIFGTVLFMGKDKEWLAQPWENFDAGLASDDAYQRFVAACQQKITTIAEFLWWVNYSMKYQIVQCRMMLNNTSSVLNQNLFHFFDSKSFNDYAVSTSMEIKMPGYDTANYKKPLRDVIYNLSNDAAYAYNKPKVRSWDPTHGRFSARKNAIALDTEFKRLYFGKNAST